MTTEEIPAHLARFATPVARKQSIEDAFISRYWEFIFTSRENSPEMLFEALRRKLPQLDPASWPERVQWGGLFINGKEALSDQRLPFPCRIEYYEPRFDFRDPYSFFPRFDPSWIQYRDEDLLVTFKPAGLPTLPAREQKRYCLKRYLEDYLGGLVHMPSRLDMATSGLVAVSCSAQAHHKLQRQFERRRVEKSYLLETASPIRFSEMTVDRPIGKDPQHPILRKVVSAGGQDASTYFRVVGHGVHAVLDGSIPSTLLLAQPHTGRTHQIRVHALYGGFPLIGDPFYGGYPDAELHLISFRLRLAHPLTRANLEVTLAPNLWPKWAAGLQLSRPNALLD
jgi:23S rRNA-/tRNA-specific pseudouridylate synthase